MEFDEINLLRHVKVGPTEYRIKLYFEDQCENTISGDGRIRLGYQFITPSDGVMFEGKDFYPSTLYDPDTNRVLQDLLGFLTLQPGDTDPEYFKDYTDEQMSFATSSICEYLQLFAQEDSLDSFRDVEE